MEYYSAIKNEILPFATMWMDRERQILDVTTYLWNLKNETNTWNKMETDSQTENKP